MSNITDRAKILVVDDVPENLIAMEDSLCDLDADIHLASSGFEALALATQFEFSVVLMDVQMPGMDGFETAENLRMNKHTESIPIIFVTAISKEKAHMFKGYKLGAVDYLFKPVDPHVLRAKVKIFIDIFYQKTLRLSHTIDELEQVKIELLKKNKELQGLAAIDSLTMLSNRSTFDAELASSINYSKRHNEKLAVMFVDLDKFKSINDNHGHAHGDAVLKLFAKRLKEYTRPGDTVARLGGDEFALILKNMSNSDDALRIAKNLCRAFNQEFNINGNMIKIGFSIGMAEYPESGETPDELVKHADEQMYKSKKDNYETYTSFSTQPADCLAIDIDKSILDDLICINASEAVRFNYSPIINIKNSMVEAYVVSAHTHDDVLVDVSLVDEYSKRSSELSNFGLRLLEKHLKEIEEHIEAIDPSAKFIISVSHNCILYDRQYEEFIRIFKRHDSVRNHVSLSILSVDLFSSESQAHIISERLKELKVSISIFDFNSSLISLDLLSELRMFAIFTDQELVARIHDKNYISKIINTTKSLSDECKALLVIDGYSPDNSADCYLEYVGHNDSGFLSSEILTINQILTSGVK